LSSSSARLNNCSRCRLRDALASVHRLQIGMTFLRIVIPIYFLVEA
jgi:hypothetical protein